METIATTLSGLFIKSDAWNKAHILWYESAAQNLKDESVLSWIDRKDYFRGVDIVMKRLYPSLPERERTIKARQTFFNSVIENIKKNPGFRNQKIIAFFLSLKKKYRIALITTNTKPAVKRILKATQAENLFDIIETSNEDEKDDKILVFKRFIEKHGKPIVYIGGDKKDSYDFCNKEGIPAIFSNLEYRQEIKGVKSIHNLQELEFYLNSL